MSKDNVIPIGNKGVLIPVEGVIGSDRVHPELVWDPDTDRYSIIHENVEVYSGLDPVGRRAKMHTPSSEPNGEADLPRPKEHSPIVIGEGSPTGSVEGGK